MRIALAAITAAIAGLGTSVAHAQGTLEHPVGETMEWSYDSGSLGNAEGRSLVLAEEVIRVRDAGWLRVYFDKDTRLEGSSFIRISSALDGEIQELDRHALATWNESSAYFNGELVVVQLVAAPGTLDNRLMIDRIDTQIVPDPIDQGIERGGSGQCGICGGDDRVPSDEEWTGRLLPAGCTASIYNEFSCIVTAGHCVDGTSGDVIQFNVPNSTGSCFIQHPPVADQFPITTKQYQNSGPGGDWGVATTGPNNLGESIWQRFGQLRPIAESSVAPGTPAELTGYGVDLTCVRSQTQQFADGSISQRFGDLYTFTIDLRGGNSGSALIANDEIIGIATHCPCPNVAQRIDWGPFEAAREDICPELIGACCYENGVCEMIFETAECEAGGGTFQGFGSDCDSVDCPPQFGACCVDDGADCFNVTPTFCVETLGGTFQGVGTSCDVTDPCAPQPGACCLFDGTCEELLEDDCVAAGGSFQGSGQACGSCPPVFWACCVPEGDCFMTSPDFCTDDLGGTWMAGETCDDGACAVSKCPGDLDGSGSVDTPDLLNLLADWGPCGGCASDLDGNGQVETPDLLELLAAWGDCE